MQVDRLLVKFEDALLRGKVEIPTWSQNRAHLVTCWRVLGCDRKRCPCYGREKLRCWQQAGTFCSPHTRDREIVLKRKVSNCRQCKAFKLATPTPELRALEALNNIIFLTSFFKTGSVRANGAIGQKMDKVVTTYCLTSQEIAILPMIIARESRLEIAHEIGPPPP